jgi:hypothetical protein
MKNFERELIKMGYRHLVRKDVWAKPVAFHLFLFETDKNTRTDTRNEASEFEFMTEEELYKLL